jgi:cell division protein FtsZ
LPEESSEGDCVAVGVGSAGSRIVSMLSKESLLIDRYAYLSCDETDFQFADGGEKMLIESPIDQKLTPAMVRGLSVPSMDSIRDVVQGARVVFVVAGLGRATGTGLAPLVAQLAQEAGAATIGVAIMPFEFEKKLRFYAGISLRRLRSAARGVIVIDNNNLLKSSPEDSLTDIYKMANGEAVRALASILARPSESNVSVGLNKVLGSVFQPGYSLLGVARSGSTDKAEEAIAGAVISISKVAEAKEVSAAVVMLTGDASLSGSDVALAVRRLGSMMNNQGVDVEYGVSYSGTSQLQVSLLACGFKSTKFDDYDPLAKIFGRNSIDDSMEFALQEGMEILPACD